MRTCELPTDIRILTLLHLSVFLSTHKVRIYRKFYGDFSENVMHKVCTGPFSSSKGLVDEANFGGSLETDKTRRIMNMEVTRSIILLIIISTTESRRCINV